MCVCACVCAVDLYVGGWFLFSIVQYWSDDAVVGVSRLDLCQWWRQSVDRRTHYDGGLRSLLLLFWTHSHLAFIIIIIIRKMWKRICNWCIRAECMIFQANGRVQWACQRNVSCQLQWLMLCVQSNMNVRVCVCIAGVGGAIYLVIPSRCGVCVRAPPLDQHGNSVRSIEFCKRLVDRLQWSVLDVLFTGHANRLWTTPASIRLKTIYSIVQQQQQQQQMHKINNILFIVCRWWSLETCQWTIAWRRQSTLCGWHPRASVGRGGARHDGQHASSPRKSPYRKYR